MSFEENIRNWIKTDNEIKEKQNNIKHLRIEREKYNENILEYIKENNLANATIKIGDGKLRFIETNYPQPLTYKLICESLCEYFEDDEELVKELMIYIKSRRTIKTVQEIKRYGISS
tara:strand:- start:2052 stop:2402 length:351 start_codon:yes stop_codon:yes gene_type:complete